MTHEDVYKYIDVNPLKAKQAIFWGTRIRPEHILEDIANGLTLDEILASHPKLTANHLEAAALYCKMFATDNERLLIAALGLLSPS